MGYLWPAHSWGCCSDRGTAPVLLLEPVPVDGGRWRSGRGTRIPSPGVCLAVREEILVRCWGGDGDLAVRDGVEMGLETGSHQGPRIAPRDVFPLSWERPVSWDPFRTSGLLRARVPLEGASSGQMMGCLRRNTLGPFTEAGLARDLFCFPSRSLAVSGLRIMWVT